MLNRHTVAVVDDDESVRESLPELLRELGFEAHAFDSAERLLDSQWLEGVRCVIADVVMPGIGGFDLQQQIKRRVCKPAFIFITASRDEAIRRRAIEQGAVDCLFKPFSDTALIQALNRAFQTE